MTRVLAAAVYPMKAAATRLRLGPVVDELNRSGSTAQVLTFLDDEGLQPWLAGGHARLRPAIHGLARLPLLAHAVASCDLMVLQREILPLDTPILERRIARRSVPFVWDIDDALWERPPSRARLRGSPEKYRWLAQNAAEVWAGSRHTAAWAEAAGAREVLVVPTAVNVPETAEESEREEDLLVWIGTPSTGPYIERLLYELRSDLQGWRVLIVGAAVSVPNGVAVEQQPWTEMNEHTALRRAAIGLYPLDTTQPTTAGKSALKAILFMAHGIPVIATSTQSNRDVMEHGQEGFFATDSDDWIRALRRLEDQQTRRQLGANGHRRAMTAFNSKIWGARLANRLRALQSPASRRPDTGTSGA